MPEANKESPHGKGPYGERQQRDLLGGMNLPEHTARKITGQMLDQGFFDEKSNLENPSAQPDKIPRAPRFRRGTVLYKVVQDADGNPKIPRNPREAEDLARETLQFDQHLEVDEKCIGIGKRGKEVIKIAGKSDYGAFVVVHYHKTDEKGREIVEERLASLTQRRQKSQNEKLRFKRTTQ